MKSTSNEKEYTPFDNDGNKVYIVNGGRCQGKVWKTINDLCEYINQKEKEKQDLIKYLEDKIKDSRTEVYRLGNTLDDYFKYEDTIKTIQIEVKVYQEILDKIKEGNYENN